jgi:predicted Zn-ribbon and HTH transcriptional regulator
MEVAWIEAPISNGRRLPTRLIDVSAQRKAKLCRRHNSLLDKEANIEDCSYHFDDSIHSLDRCQNCEDGLR